VTRAVYSTSLVEEGQSGKLTYWWHLATAGTPE
jgi:hypothetical protein